VEVAFTELNNILKSLPFLLEQGKLVWWKKTQINSNCECTFDFGWMTGLRISKLLFTTQIPPPSKKK